jgi:formylmethanofuran dehydrogenase subunit E
MLRLFMLLGFCNFAAIGFSEDAVENLPVPHYHPQKSDPAWLKYAVQFHGHLGPMLTFGARMGTAALHAVDAKGYFDVEITCEGPFARPPASCFLDGLQISTGATLGKRNLHWTEKPQIVIRVKNTRTGKTAILRPKKEFLALLPSEKNDKKGKPADRKKTAGDHHAFDGLARRIATMSEREILLINP